MTPQWIPWVAGPRASLIAIVVSNLIPVFGVAFLGWDAVQILILYWVENLVIGVLTLPRILAAQKAEPPSQDGNPAFREAQATGLGSRAFTGCFFVVHYGFFCLGHAVFAFMLARDFITQEGAGAPGVWDRTFGNSEFYWAILAIAVLNVVGQVRDWWIPGKWRDASPVTEMFRPYGRIMVLHFTVLLGAWVLTLTHAPTYAVLLLCLLKAVAELGGLALFSGQNAGERRP